MNNLPKVVTLRCLEQDLNPRPTDCKFNAIPVALPCHPVDDYLTNISHFAVFHMKFLDLWLGREEEKICCSS